MSPTRWNLVGVLTSHVTTLASATLLAKKEEGGPKRKLNMSPRSMRLSTLESRHPSHADIVASLFPHTSSKVWFFIAISDFQVYHHLKTLPPASPLPPVFSRLLSDLANNADSLRDLLRDPPRHHPPPSRRLLPPWLLQRNSLSLSFFSSVLSQFEILIPKNLIWFFGFCRLSSVSACCWRSLATSPESSTLSTQSSSSIAIGTEIHTTLLPDRLSPTCASMAVFGAIFLSPLFVYCRSFWFRGDRPHCCGWWWWSENERMWYRFVIKIQLFFIDSYSWFVQSNWFQNLPWFRVWYLFTVSSDQIPCYFLDVFTFLSYLRFGITLTILSIYKLWNFS